MIFVFRQNENFADIHSHLIPYVDDGASDMEDAKRLILEEYIQGVRLLVLTPHLRYGYFDTPLADVQRHFEELKKWVSESNLKDLKICLSREYHCDKRFEALLEGYVGGSKTIFFEGREYEPQKEVIPFGAKRCILLEFSTGLRDVNELKNFVTKAVDAGLTPIIAHAERYLIVQNNIHALDEVKALGANVQVNVDALLGLESKDICSTAKRLVAEKIADIVASDSHDPERRKPRLDRCFKYLKRKVGEEQSHALMRDKAYELIF